MTGVSDESSPRRWTLHANRRPSNFVDDAWSVFGPRPSTAGSIDNSLMGENVEVVSLSEYEAVVAERDRLRGLADRINGLLPRVYDGTHLVDCPYVDVLMRVRAVLAESRPTSKETKG